LDILRNVATNVKVERGRSARHHHTGVRIRAALARVHHRHHRRRGVLLGLHQTQATLGADDSLDVFGVHGVGGMTGTLTGVFAVAAFSASADASGTAGLLGHNPRQVLIQLYGVVATLLWHAIRPTQAGPTSTPGKAR
jgi:hypothetical protein